ncbi:MAG TPA: hypothetical protein VGG10_01140 [Rhizomicrobium sp.]|jgi:hypothetical protein
MVRPVGVFLFACFCLAMLPFPAAAADDQYTVRNIHVDASAVSSSAAQNAAIAQGRPKAWQMLYRRLAKQADWAKQPPLDDLGIERLMRTYTVGNERRSTTRYTADITYIFNPDQVRRLLKNTGVAYLDAAATKRILIVPMSPGYSPAAPWSVAWRNPKLLNGAVPLQLPPEDPDAAAALGRLNFDKATWKNVAAMATRLQVSEIALLLLNGNSVRIHHLSLTPIAGNAVEDVPFSGGMPGATAATQNALVEYWKDRSAIDFSHHQHATVTAHFDSLSDWATLLASLSAVPTVTGVEVVAIDNGEARLGVVYVGSLDQMHDALANAKIALNQNDTGWSLGFQSSSASSQ